MTTNIEKPELVTVFFAERTGEKAGTIVVRRIRFSNVVASDSQQEKVRQVHFQAHYSLTTSVT